MRLPLDRRQRIWAVTIAATLILLAAVLFGPPGDRSRPNEPARDRDPSAEGWLSSPEDVPGPDDLAEVERIQREVAPEQPARLTSRSGASLNLSAGTIVRPTVVEMVRYEVDHPRSLDGQAFDLQPDGLSLHAPADLRIPLPLGVQPDEVEIARYDPRGGLWRAEPHQQAAEDGQSLVAELHHFSLRRLRIRPGMDIPRPEGIGRATFHLEADAGNTFQRYVEGRWRTVPRRSRGYRELMALGRSGRHDLIASGRLRAVAAPEAEPRVVEDEALAVAMSPEADQARTGWVQVERLDPSGEPTGDRVVARVDGPGPGPAQRAAGVILTMSRATAEALGLRWGEDFGIAERPPHRAWIALDDPAGGTPLRYLPVRVHATDPPSGVRGESP